MKLFKRSKTKNASCMNCRSRTTAKDGHFCTKDVPAHIHVRHLSDEGVKRLCAPLPEERICPGHQPM